MKGKPDIGPLFRFSESVPVKPIHRLVLLTLMIAGIISIIRFAIWWFNPEYVGNLVLYLMFSMLLGYVTLRLVLIWINYLFMEKPDTPRPPEGLRVAIFTTSSPGEPLSMFEKTLVACSKLTYPHTTYLLDDTQDPAFKACAEKNGAVWLELVGIPGAKAGKINEALKLTDEEFILVLDPDHIPFPEFLEHTLGFFRNPEIGFVQVSQAYYNQYRSFTAAGAAEQTYAFYGPTQMGLSGAGAAVAIGANCTFRRAALESIGGHGIGLAEDLITSIRLHAAGWKSVYNPVVVSRGLVPEDFGSFCKQQLKWSRGVYEVAFAELPRLFSRLTFWQRLSYGAIGSYYLTGVLSFFYTVLPYFILFTGQAPTHMPFEAFVSTGIPILIVAVLIYLYVQQFLSDRQHEMGLHLKGMVLKYACWPVYTLGFVLGVLNAELPYIPTAKQADIGKISPFAKPIMAQIGVYLICVTGIWIHRWYFLSDNELVATLNQTWSMLAFCTITFVLNVWGLYAAIQSQYMKADNSWNHLRTEPMKN